MRQTRTYRASAKCLLNAVKISNRAPTLCNQTLLSDIKVKHVKCVVDRLDLPHLDKPNLDVFGSCYQHTVSMVLSLCQNLENTKNKEFEWYNYNSQIQVCLLNKETECRL